MATILSMPPSAPSENWDSDFEFNPNLPRKSPPTRMSIATEDWDTETPSHSRHSSQDPGSSQLSNWVEPGPSTPSKRPVNAEENWDDFFEDKIDSPSNSSKPPRENYDDDFDLSPAKSMHQQCYPAAEHTVFDDDDDVDDDMDFNQDKEEDRTVTARSRRAALSRLNVTPPPPVPPIPFSLLSTTNSRDRPFPRSPTASVFSVPTSGRDSVAYSYNSTTHLRPTISRSSIAGFANLPPSPPIHKERERRRLRKKSRPQDPATIEMNTRSAYNHPSPFLMNSSRESIRETDGEGERQSRPVTPRSPSPAATPDPVLSMSPPRTNRNSVSSSSGLPSPPSKTPLLSRIGSVKKWGVRKKRASSSPSEIMLQEGEVDQQENRTRPSSAAGLPTPSTPSSKPNWFFRASSGNGSVNTPAQVTNSSKLAVNEHQTPKASARTAFVVNGPDMPPYDTPSKLVKRKSFGFVPLRPRNGPINDDVEGLSIPPSLPSSSRNPALGSTSDLPSDLEAELGLESDVAAGRSPSKKKKKNRKSSANVNANPPLPPQMQSRHGSYGGLGLGRAPDAGRSTEDLDQKRNRVRSSSRSKSRDKRTEANREEPEGSRGFMGSVRRISFAGKHKRTKSGVSLSSVAEGLKRSLDHRKETSDDAMDVDELPRSQTPSRNGLLPPIELSPPSPPRIASGSTLGPIAYDEDSLDSDTMHPPSSSPNFSSSPSLLLKSSASTVKPPLTASLGRSTIAPAMTSSSSMPVGSSNVPRRNSLGDLKIPARISQAQVGLRRDLGMVKEFATNVEQLKNLQMTYHNLVVEMQCILDAHAHKVSSRAASPVFRPLSRMRSNTSGATAPSPTHDSYKILAAAFYTINSKYKIAWECAELLIELGGGPSESSPSSPPSTSISAPTMMGAAIGSSSNQAKKSRERAITLSSGEQSKPGTPTPGAYSSSSYTSGTSSPPLVNAPNMAWRASTGRHDLNQRQLVLLREMLNHSNSSFVTENTQSPIVEDPPTVINREWRWGDGMNSTITLPSEESSTLPNGNPVEMGKKRRSSRLKGMRDMLRSLTKQGATITSTGVPPSTTSLSTESSMDSHAQHRYPHAKVPTYGRRRAKTSSGPDAASSVRERERDVRSTSPYTASASLSVKASPRRPSLASIFRIGNKNKPSPTPSAMGGISTDNVNNVHTRESSGASISDEEDWDRLEYPHELDGTTRGREPPSTIRGRSPYMPESQLHALGTTTPNKRSASNSQTSLWVEPPSSSSVGVPARATRLSNVEENVDDVHTSKTSLKRTGSNPVNSKQINKTGSVRSMPPQPLLPDRLAMTPENIKPLLENAREVHARLTDCIGEIRSLLAE